MFHSYGEAASKTNKMWTKFKNTTKKTINKLTEEKDGDTPEQSIVHKALVKHYKHREPFQGYPGWLGHVEEQPQTKNESRPSFSRPEPQQQAPQETYRPSNSFRGIYQQQSTQPTSRWGSQAEQPTSRWGSQTQAPASAPPTQNASQGSSIRDRLKSRNFRTSPGV